MPAGLGRNPAGSALCFASRLPLCESLPYKRTRRGLFVRAD